MANTIKKTALKQLADYVEGFSLFVFFAQAAYFFKNYSDKVKHNISAFFLLFIADIIESIESILKFKNEPNKNLSNVLRISFNVIKLGLLTAVVMTSGLLLFQAYLLANTTYHLLSTLTNTFKALLAPKRSKERLEYSQALLDSGLKFIIFGAMSALFLSPLSPAASLGLTITSGIVTLGHMAWTMSDKLRDKVYKRLGIEIVKSGFNKDQLPQKKTLRQPVSSEQSDKFIRQHQEPSERFIAKHHASLFKRAYREEVVEVYIAHNQPDNAKAYLKTELNKKIELLSKKQQLARNKVKHNVLQKALMFLNQLDADKEHCIKAFSSLESLYHTNIKDHDFTQSFFSDVGDCEDLLRAVYFYMREVTEAPEKVAESAQIAEMMPA